LSATSTRCPRRFGNYASIDDPMRVLGTALAAGLKDHNWSEINGSKGIVVFNRETIGVDTVETGSVLLCLPNFGDENGITVALENAGEPVLIQAFTDNLGKMAPAVRRYGFCGKFPIYAQINTAI